MSFIAVCQIVLLETETLLYCSSFCVSACIVHSFAQKLLLLPACNQHLGFGNRLRPPDFDPSGRSLNARFHYAYSPNIALCDMKRVRRNRRTMSFSCALDYKLLVALSVVVCISSAGAADPSPIVASTSTDFFGYDGSWSAVNIQVGTPEQFLYVLPSTLAQETWVVGPAGCDGTSTCTNKRGGLFTSNESLSFKPQGLYELSFDPQLGNTGFGYYGLDTVSVDDATFVPNQIVAVVNSTEYWLGSLGLGVQNTRFAGTENITPLLSSLVETVDKIPSRSFGYTAGASYRASAV